MSSTTISSSQKTNVVIMEETPLRWVDNVEAKWVLILKIIIAFLIYWRLK